MLEFLDKLRELPEHERRGIALITAFVITFIVLIVWLSVVLSGPGPEEVPDTMDSFESTRDIFSTIIDSFNPF